MKGQKTMNYVFIFGGMFVVVALALILFGGGIFRVGSGTGVDSNPPPVPTLSLECPSTSITAEVVAGLGLTQNTTYVATTAYVVPAGKNVPIASGLTTPGTTLTFKSVTVPCADSYSSGVYVYLINGTTGSFSSTKSDLLQYIVRDSNGNAISKKNSVTYNGVVQGLSTLTMTWRSTADSSNVSDSTDNNIVESSATAMAKGTSRSRYLDLSIVPTASQLGSVSDGIAMVIDTVNSSVFSNSAISLELVSAPPGWSLTKVDCSKYNNIKNQLSADICYATPVITSISGTPAVRLKVTETPDVGTPSASSDPVIYFKGIYYGTDNTPVLGNIIVDGYDSSGTALGEAVSQAKLDNSAG